MNHKEQDIKHTDTYINHTATEKWEFALQKRLKQCSPSLYDAGPVQERISPVHGPQQPSLPEYYESGRTAGGRLSAAAEWKRAVCAFDGNSVP